MHFVFSIQDTYVRQAATEYKNLGLVIFQFEKIKNGVRKALATYAGDGAKFWSDKEIGSMIDEVYRVLDEIQRAA